MTVQATVNLPAETKSITLEIGKKLLQCLKDNGIPIQSGCGGIQACCTCQVQFDEKSFKKLPKQEEVEEDMLTFSPNQNPLSRLSCALVVNQMLEGSIINIVEDNLGRKI